MAGLFDYKTAEGVPSGIPFDALVMAAIMRADSANLVRLQGVFPELVTEVRERYNAPGGRLASERG